MPKLTIMKGLPASGKSTQARKMVDESGNIGRVNRDDLRKMLFNGKWTGRRERIVVNIEKAIANILLEAGQGVIVDDTNLSDSAQALWRNFANENNKVKSVVVEDMSVKFNESYTYFNECIRRDAARHQGAVGQAVIESMALRTGSLPYPDYDKYAIIDMDGTLSDVSKRVHFVRGDKPNWNEFFKACWEDAPNYGVVEWVKALGESVSTGVLIVSGRPADKCATDTIAWLKHYEIPFDHIFMRQAGDSRDDTIVKKQILDGIVNWIGSKDRIAFCVDDRPSVIKMWRDEGLTVYPVHTDRWEGNDND